MTLGPNARALVTACRDALRATDVDRERIARALSAQLGPNVLLPESGVVAVSRGLGWQLPTALGVCFVTGALLVALQWGTQKLPTARASVAVPAAISSMTGMLTASRPVIERPELAALVAPAPATPVIAKPRQHSLEQRDDLAQEVALLSKATSALNANHASEALSVLSEYQRRFPDGMLSEERRAAKARALCALGRVAEGRDELARLPPGSLALSRVAEACQPIGTP